MIVERCNDLIDAHWTEWLGAMADVLVREGTYFRHGFLDEITVRSAPRRHPRPSRALHRARGSSRPGCGTALRTIRRRAPVRAGDARAPRYGRRRSHASVRPGPRVGCASTSRTTCSRPSRRCFPQSSSSSCRRPARAIGTPATRSTLISQLAATFTHLTSVILDCRVPYRWYPNGDASAGEALLAEAGRSPLVTFRR